MLYGIARFIFIKAIYKKFILGGIFFVFAYFGLDELTIVKSAVGTKQFEYAQEISVVNERMINGPERSLRYRISNTGYQPIALKVEVTAGTGIPEYRLGDVFKIYSNTVDQREIRVLPNRPYGNKLDLNVINIPPGLGLEIFLADDKGNPNYLSDINIETMSPSQADVFEHSLNRSPFSIILARCALLLAICLALSISLFSFLGAAGEFMFNFREHH